ncbi:hypothetical protein ABW20_dc0101587 [Dactylellina cionopaga]|nr:hypothetical protein ABW20_dc0101587 [Dactylellina cionopaga]
MKSTIAIFFSFFAAAITAAPTGTTFPSVTVSLSNDLSGANGIATIEANGVDRYISELFGNTPVGTGGYVVASSAQLTNFPQGVFCIIKKGDAPVGILNFMRTFADLDGNPNAAIPQNLDGAILNCQV